MVAWSWLLLLDNTFVVIGVILFLVVKQRAYTIVAICLTILLIVINVLMFLGYRNWFVLAIPFIVLIVISIFGRWFLPHSVNIDGSNSLNLKRRKSFLIILMICAILMIIISFTILLLIFTNSSK